MTLSARNHLVGKVVELQLGDVMAGVTAVVLSPRYPTKWKMQRDKASCTHGSVLGNNFKEPSEK
jgi:hypothetical protein